ncbi:hypothetical protein BJY16_006147 [Actinoplanes octamycinicus]|uniref:Uncharacterized protein n=1 Tax=Actinoplanes octamycinicus TaxID=135948 RepID=A0A7W7H2G5_9ACTN|nr:hypothetical protein [Actinoplanes octamycinicus]MBB4742688.1 hypothetical protein [Actinoplanes octamycinicus]GIE62991.1 hypothetical protein Aoc01nite_83930 [Actinoplanes octamycinicus]
MTEHPPESTEDRVAGTGLALGLASVAAVALLCCLPGAAFVGGLDSSCGDGFGHGCRDVSGPAFTVWPFVTGGVAVLAFLALVCIPLRAMSLRLLAGLLIVVPPLANALVAFVEMAESGSP